MSDRIVKETEKMLTPELQEMARFIQSKIPLGWGFGLMIFRLNNKPGEPLLWISNATRESMIESMKEFIEKNGGTS